MRLTDLMRQIVLPNPQFSAKTVSLRRKCPIFHRTLCPYFVCFHTHNGFQRHKLTSFFRASVSMFDFMFVKNTADSPQVAKMRAIPARHGRYLSFPGTDFTIKYTHTPRLCQEQNAAGRGTVCRRGGITPPGGAVDSLLQFQTRSLIRGGLTQTRFVKSVAGQRSHQKVADLPIRSTLRSHARLVKDRGLTKQSY